MNEDDYGPGSFAAHQHRMGERSEGWEGWAENFGKQLKKHDANTDTKHNQGAQRPQTKGSKMQRTYNSGNAQKNNAPAKSNATRNATGGSKERSEFTPSPKGTQPTYLLKVKDAEGNFVTLTGLFANEGKNGVFYKGKARGDSFDGVDFFVMPKLEDQQQG
jgi:hypothetical protein